jgi:hypothetical protein
MTLSPIGTVTPALIQRKLPFGIQSFAKLRDAGCQGSISSTEPDYYMLFFHATSTRNDEGPN